MPHERRYEMKIADEHFRFAQAIFQTRSALRDFLAEVKEKYPEFFAELGRSCDEFVEHRGFGETDTSQRRRAAEFFLSYTCAKIGALYKANHESIPPETISFFREFKNDCVSQEKLQERFDCFCLVNRDWAEYFISYARGESLCSHGLGAMYAWADAFIEAQKLEEKRRAESAETARLTESLLPVWIDGVDTTLPEGKKSIGEE